MDTKSDSFKNIHYTYMLVMLHTKENTLYMAGNTYI